MAGKAGRNKRAGAATIYDVATRAGVSVVTVSRVFNNYQHVSPRTRQKVLAAARASNFSPKLVAKPKRIGLVIGHLDQLHGGGYKQNMLMHLISAAARRGYGVEFIPASNIDLAVQSSVDGVIEFALTSRELGSLKELGRIPVVLINKEVASANPWSSVCSDQEAEAREAAEHLMASGHRKIALVLDEKSGWSAETRIAGFKKTMTGAGAKGSACAVFSVAEQSVGDIAREIAKGGFTGVINLSDNAGLALLSGLRADNGKRIPADISVVMLENKWINENLSPALTSIEQPLAELAEAAVDGLVEAVESGGGAFHRVFPCRLIHRDSVRVLN